MTRRAPITSFSSHLFYILQCRPVWRSRVPTDKQRVNKLSKHTRRRTSGLPTKAIAADSFLLLPPLYLWHCMLLYCKYMRCHRGITRLLCNTEHELLFVMRPGPGMIKLLRVFSYVTPLVYLLNS